MKVDCALLMVGVRNMCPSQCLTYSSSSDGSQTSCSYCLLGTEICMVMHALYAYRKRYLTLTTAPPIWEETVHNKRHIQQLMSDSGMRKELSPD